MDIIRPTTKNRMTARPQPRGQSHRRAYLDTYARRSRGEVVAAAAEVLPEPPVSTPPPLPESPVTPPIPEPPAAPANDTPPPVVDQNFTVESQPGYTPFDVARPAAATQPTPAATPQQSGNYLDILVQRHEAAVAVAPEQLETVVSPAQIAAEPVFVPITEEDQAENTEKLEANLRALYADSLLGDASAKSKPLSYTRAMATSAFACGILAVGIFTFFARVDSVPIVAQPVGSPVIEVEVPVEQPRPRSSATAEDSRVAADPSHPVRIVASEAGVNAPVTGLGLTHDGLIDVPEAYGVVGWYNRGVVPGKAGPAVIVGHYTEGLGGAFDNLHKLKDGDLITITNGRGQNFTYKVTKKAEYAKDKVPMEKLFQNSDKPRLEIITCAGKWQADNYDKRLVVTAELVR